MSRKSPHNSWQRQVKAAIPFFSRSPKSKGFKGSFRRRLKYFYWRLVRLQGTPEALARGLACGVFCRIISLFGSQTLLALLLAFLFREIKSSRLLDLGLVIRLTSVPIYVVQFPASKWLLQ
jgi:uncharacterized protein (DUF2062 family)